MEINVISSENSINQMNFEHRNRKEACGKPDPERFCLCLWSAACHWGGKSDSGWGHGRLLTKIADKEEPPQ